MPLPDASQVRDAVAAVLAGLYPTIPLQKRKGKPGPDPKASLAGYVPGDSSTGLVVAGQDPEEIDKYGNFEEVSVGYPVIVAYVKPNPSGGWQDDDDIRAKRAEIRAALYKPALPGLAQVFDVETKALRPYEDVGGTLVFTAWLYTFTCSEARPE